MHLACGARSHVELSLLIALREPQSREVKDSIHRTVDFG